MHNTISHTRFKCKPLSEAIQWISTWSHLSSILWVEDFLRDWSISFRWRIFPIWLCYRRNIENIHVDNLFCIVSFPNISKFASVGTDVQTLLIQWKELKCQQPPRLIRKSIKIYLENSAGDCYVRHRWRTISRPRQDHLHIETVVDMYWFFAEVFDIRIRVEEHVMNGNLHRFRVHSVNGQTD